jgi:hypothetical protein
MILPIVDQYVAAIRALPGRLLPRPAAAYMSVPIPV